MGVKTIKHPGGIYTLYSKENINTKIDRAWGFFYNKIYTAVTFISLGALLVILSAQKKEFINTFYLTYLVITASFFLLVNGILTGGTLENPPVWYNNSETLNIRIWTIPIEDFFYSMLLLLSNIWLFETFKSNAAEQQNN